MGLATGVTPGQPVTTLLDAAGKGLQLQVEPLSAEVPLLAAPDLHLLRGLQAVTVGGEQQSWGLKAIAVLIQGDRPAQLHPTLPILI